MPATVGTSAASRFAAQPSHRFDADLGRALSVLFELDSPDLQRGSPFPVRIRLQNTGAGHHVPTGSPFKRYRVQVVVEDAQGEALTGTAELDLARDIGSSPPWPTLADNRIPPGGEVSLEHVFEVAQKKAAQRANLVVRVASVVPSGDASPDKRTVLLERRLPVNVL
jgi:hypothetical protein